MLKRISIIFIVLLLAISFGLYVVNDAGYLLLTYRQWSIETPLWFSMIALVIAFFLFSYTLRLFSFLFSLRRRVHRWRHQHRKQHAHTITTRGLIEFIEGNWPQAEKHLIKAIAIGENPLVNYLAAARAAQEQGENIRRDKYLREAQQAMPKAKVAVELTQAQLQIASGQMEQALATLSHLQTITPNHKYVLKLLQRLYVQLSEWENLIKLLPVLRKRRVLPSEKLDELEVSAYRGVIQSISEPNVLDHLSETWKHFPRKMRNHVSVINSYVTQLLKYDADTQAEQCLVKTLKKQRDASCRV